MRRPCYLHPHHRTTWAAAPPRPRLTRRGRSSRRRGAGRGRPPPRPEHSLRHGTGSGTPLDCPRRTSSITRCVPAGLAPTWSKTRHSKAVPHPLVMHQILLHPARAKLTPRAGAGEWCKNDQLLSFVAATCVSPGRAKCPGLTSGVTAPRAVTLTPPPHHRSSPGQWCNRVILRGWVQAVSAGMGSCPGSVGGSVRIAARERARTSSPR